jgi:hypothetical protein
MRERSVGERSLRLLPLSPRILGPVAVAAVLV